MRPIAVVKRGAKGATVLARDAGQRADRGSRSRPTPIDAADTTGAGDAFDAGFLVGWLAARAAGCRCRRRSSGPPSPGIARRRASCRRHGRSCRSAEPARPTRPTLDVAAEVAAALAARDGRPVVALESTLISHGLPYPQNLEVARASEAAVRAAGAVPATVAIHAGRLLSGSTRTSLLALATAPAGSVRKAARPSLAAALADGGWAATTVSATMIAAHAAGIARLRDRRDRRRPSRRAARRRRAPDASTSRPTSRSSARTPMAVVCAGPKAILDVPATLEYLETRGVPVVAVGQPELPGFYARRPASRRRHRVADVAAAARPRRDPPRRSASAAGILVCVPVPEAEALPDDVARDAVSSARSRRRCGAGSAGPPLTPWLLAADRGS